MNFIDFEKTCHIRKSKKKKIHRVELISKNVSLKITYISKDNM